MTLLLLGLFVWYAFHLLPSAGIGIRRKIVVKIGLIPYKAVFALVIISSVVMMVFGWRAMVPQHLYVPPEWGRSLTLFLVLVTFILFVAAQMKTNIKRVLRHPQLYGLLLWCIGHLLANGDSRSVLLFGWMFFWGISEVFFINRRDGEWKKPEAVPVKYDIIVLVMGIVLYAVMVAAHPYLSGIPIM